MKGILRMTELRIIADDQVFGSSYGPTAEGKYGLYIGTLEETPSGSKRPRDLVTSEPTYESAEAAKAAADKIISTIRTEEDNTHMVIPAAQNIYAGVALLEQLTDAGLDKHVREFRTSNTANEATHIFSHFPQLTELSDLEKGYLIGLFTARAYLAGMMPGNEGKF